MLSGTAKFRQRPSSSSANPQSDSRDPFQSSDSSTRTPDRHSAIQSRRALGDQSGLGRAPGTPVGRLLASEGLPVRSPRRVRQRSWQQKFVPSLSTSSTHCRLTFSRSTGSKTGPQTSSSTSKPPSSFSPSIPPATPLPFSSTPFTSSFASPVSTPPSLPSLLSSAAQQPAGTHVNVPLHSATQMLASKRCRGEDTTGLGAGWRGVSASSSFFSVWRMRHT
jgi:hypothetical protein